MESAVDGWSLLGLVNPERVMMFTAFVALGASNFGHNVRVICILHGVLEKEKRSGTCGSGYHSPGSIQN